MKSAALFGMAAILPAAVYPAPVASAGAAAMIALVCSDTSGSRIIIIPGGGEQPAPDRDRPCCAKACHGGHPRKRFLHRS
jgi:hypothetical protein